ncbi:MAG: hypothetical protein CL916_07125 [Deltaproteobacteria bacterium]|nr:hypothetical protein [Deltaproteobacteria bacterium]
MMRLFHYILPLLVYIFLHIFLLWSIDLRDMPGAAGTEVIYKASIGERKGDITVLTIQWLSHYLDVGPQKAGRILSSTSGLIQLISLMLCGAAFSKRSAIILGWIGACWSMSHYFPLLSGADPVCVSIAWLSIGLCWWGASQKKPIGVLAVMCGVSLAPLAVSIKELGLPPIVLLALTPLWIKNWNRHLLYLSILIGYCAYWSYAWMWPTNPTRLQTEFSFSFLSSGWYRLLDLYDRGIPQGKYDQLLILSGLLLFTSTKKIKTRILVWICGCILIIGTAYVLGPRTRPRYITPASLGILCSISYSLSLWKKTFTQRATFLLCSLLICDSWAYYDTWAQKRQRIVGGSKERIPNPPQWWTRQYQHANDITHRDLSLYGAIDLIEVLEKHTGLATMRLRDERHRSLLAFAQISGKKSLVLDPGSCCAGEPVNEKCAQRVVESVLDLGYGIVLPTLQKGVERIYPNEEKWRNLLLKSHNNWNQGSFWYDAHMVNPTLKTQLPCQQKAPFREPK